MVDEMSGKPSRVLGIALVVVALSGVADAASLVTPAVSQGVGQTIYCLVVNAGQQTVAEVRFEQLNSRGIVLHSGVGANIPPGAIAGIGQSTASARRLLYCRFIVADDVDKASLRFSIENTSTGLGFEAL